MDCWDRHPQVKEVRKWTHCIPGALSIWISLNRVESTQRSHQNPCSLHHKSTAHLNYQNSTAFLSLGGCLNPVLCFGKDLTVTGGRCRPALPVYSRHLLLECRAYALRHRHEERCARSSLDETRRLFANLPAKAWVRGQKIKHKRKCNTSAAHAGVCPLGVRYGFPDELRVLFEWEWISLYY